MIGNGFISAWGNLDPAAFSPTLFDAVVTTSAELVAAITDNTINTIFIRDGAYSLAATYDLGAAANNVTLMFGETEAGVVIDMNGNDFTNSNQNTHPVMLINLYIQEGRILNIGTHTGTDSYMGGMWNITIDLNSDNTIDGAFKNCENMNKCTVINGLGTPVQREMFEDCHAMRNCVCEDCQDVISFLDCRTGVLCEITGNTATIGPGVGSNRAAFFDCSQFDSVTVAGDFDGLVFQGCRNFSNLRIGITEVGDLNNSIFEDCRALTNIRFTGCTISGARLFENCYDVSDVFFDFGALRNSFDLSGGGSLFLSCVNLNNIDFHPDTGVAHNIVGGIVFQLCEQVNNVLVNITNNAGAIDPTIAFDQCTYLSNIVIDNFTPNVTTPTGFHDCNYLMHCEVGTSDIYVPFDGCIRLVNCTTTAVPNAAGGQIAFLSCNYLTQCLATGHAANLVSGFSGCDHVLWCQVTVGSATADYNNCTNVFESVGAGAVQYLNCTFVGGDYIGQTNVASPVTCFSGVQYDNTGAGGAVTYNLPVPARDDKIRFICTVAQDMVVTAQAGDTIRINGEVSAAGGTVTIDDIGSVLELVALDANTWYAVAAVGGPFEIA